MIVMLMMIGFTSYVWDRGSCKKNWAGISIIYRVTVNMDNIKYDRAHMEETRNLK